MLATDAKIADSFSNDANTNFASVKEIPDGWEGLDIGPDAEKLFTEVIKNSKTILWNGPVGVFEFDNFDKGSRAVSNAIVEATQKGAFSLVGGGDSVACVNKFGHADQVSMHPPVRPAEMIEASTPCIKDPRILQLKGPPPQSRYPIDCRQYVRTVLFEPSFCVISSFLYFGPIFQSFNNEHFVQSGYEYLQFEMTPQ